MSSRDKKAESSSRQSVLDALKGASKDKPLDSYQVARLAKVTPMQACRTLCKLHGDSLVATADELGTINDLAARFYLP